MKYLSNIYDLIYFTVLPQPFHTDPGDQIIVATAREENATILTKDEKIQNIQLC